MKQFRFLRSTNVCESFFFRRIKILISTFITLLSLFHCCIWTMIRYSWYQNSCSYFFPVIQGQKFAFEALFKSGGLLKDLVSNPKSGPPDFLNRSKMNIVHKFAQSGLFRMHTLLTIKCYLTILVGYFIYSGHEGWILNIGQHFVLLDRPVKIIGVNALFWL